ncbi:MAG: alpha/beta hydrolase [Longispora sp.]|nr:alpha/beta hydrolase [Longispora sp. (in: high G+C Gram-positive bacteria)]
MKKQAGVVGTLLGVAAAGVAAGVAAERVLLRRIRHNRRPEDPYAGEPFDRLPFDRQFTVVTEEDVDIYVEVVEGPAPTVVFVHGFCLDMGTFHFQRQGLQGKCRMVFFDQPGHGRSDRLAAGDYDLDALAGTLRRVIDKAAPDTPLVLVGHSMGAMAIMAFAQRWPELVRRRVLGVVLMNTSPGQLNEVTFGMPAVFGTLRRQIMPFITTAGRLTPMPIDRARRASSDLFWLLTRKYGFGTIQPSPALVSYVERMISRTSVEIIAGYINTLISHSRSESLTAFTDKEVLIIAGGVDLFTPLAHSEEMARLLPDATLLTITDGGHLSLLEHSEPVTAALITLLERVTSEALGEGVHDNE